MDDGHWTLHIGHSARCAASATSVGPEEKGHDSYRVAGSNMKKKRASPCLVGIKSARRVTGEERGVRRLGTRRLVLLAPWDTVLFSAARLSPVNFFFEAALSLQGLIMRQGLGRGRKRQHKHHVRIQTCLLLLGRGHVTVTVIALFPTVRYHLSNLCPEEEPLSSFGFAPLALLLPMVTSRPAHQNARVQCGL